MISLDIRLLHSNLVGDPWKNSHSGCNNTKYWTRYTYIPHIVGIVSDTGMTGTRIVTESDQTARHIQLHSDLFLGGLNYSAIKLFNRPMSPFLIYCSVILGRTPVIFLLRVKEWRGGCYQRGSMIEFKHRSMKTLLCRIVSTVNN